MKRRELSRKQYRAWLIMAIITVIGAILALRSFPKLDFKDPVTSIVMAIALLVVVYFERRWIMSSTDEDGRPLNKQKD